MEDTYTQNTNTAYTKHILTYTEKNQKESRSIEINI